MVTGGITLGMVLTIIIIVCTVLGYGAQFVKSFFDAKDLYEEQKGKDNWKKTRKFMNEGKPLSKPVKKKSYTVIYKDRRKK